MDPNPFNVRQHLDVPAYRYQRILMPLLARNLSFGNPQWIVWALLCVPIFGQILGVTYVAKTLIELGQPPLMALVYGLYAGFVLAIRVVLPEPLAYGCVAVAVFAYLRNKRWLGAFWMGFAFFAKEVTLLFGGAILLSFALRREWKACAIFLGVAFLPYFIWQIWLWRTFGALGLGSGGANATAFELIPFMGLLRIANYSRVYFLAMVIVFAPLIVIPSIWGAWSTLRNLLRGETHFIPLALLLHCLMMFSMPFSTYRETGGILRLSVGFVFAFLLYVAQQKQTRILRYLPFWLVYNVFLVK
jgi:hypothetical protein